MKTILPALIKNEGEAKKLLADLWKNKETYHPEDLAQDVENILGVRLFNDLEAEKLNTLMAEIYDLPGNFDPCEFIMNLKEKRDKKWNRMLQKIL